ncbi:hypothetical protein [Mesorhizobium sp. CAU 1741]|uniref:hypothetical protein n=1 Tax=Mesorhizobium sp. CAU 1741 TaxID=3140366 RepID=UPI00325AB441
MDAFEKAIRSAFDKGDPSRRDFREKVYRSAFAALERALEASPNATQAAAAQRRQALSAKISEIEAEFLPAVPAVDAAPQQQRPTAAEIEMPSVSREDRARAAPVQGALDDEIEPPSYGEYAPRSRRGRSLTAIIVTVAVLAIAGLGAWWALAPSAPQSETAAVPPLDSEDFAPDEPTGQPRMVVPGQDLGDWINVFDPTDASTVTAPGDSSAELSNENGEPFIRISSGASGSPVLFDVGQGVLEQIAGRRAVFNVVAQTEDGQETQISVDCSLAELGDCGRKRYAVGSTREEFLFEIDLPEVDPGAGGTIAINPDVEGGGKVVDIYAIRVSTTE